MYSIRRISGIGTVVPINIKTPTVTTSKGFHSLLRHPSKFATMLSHAFKENTKTQDLMGVFNVVSGRGRT